MQLHLKGSTGYDYTAYGGKVRASLESFLAKQEVTKRFMQLSTAFNGPHNPELLVFANARYGIDIGYGDIRKCVKQFENWNTKYGTKENFLKSIATTIRVLYLYNGKVNKASEIAMALLETDDDDAVEAVIGYLHLFPALVNMINEQVEGNAILELKWNKINRIRTLY